MKRKKKVTLSVVTVVLVLVADLAVAAPSADGLYATIQTTMGNVCFELYYTNVPRTVANFVSLAEGTRPWIDPRDGFISSEPYYNGIIFHRVIDGFMIQGGSPKGDGTDGPGYIFTDEFDPALRHDRPGIVSMANSGPDSNGGQFFITVAPTDWLDDVHTVFGSVVEGMQVVSNIAAVATDSGARPLVDIAITNVFITRNGTNAQVFNVSSVVPPLPLVQPATNHLYRSAGAWILDWEEHSNCAYWLFASDRVDSGWFDLVRLGYAIDWPAANITGIVINNPHVFFNVTEVQYYE